MRLIEAMEILQRPATGGGGSFSVALACGFEPLHVRTFLSAELTQRLPGARIEISTGLFDDLFGNLRRALAADVDAVAVAIEWSDLDPRLGLRRLGGWRVDHLAEIVTDATVTLNRLELELSAAAGPKRVVCLTPTLPLPPLFPEPPARSGDPELALRSAVAAFTARLGSQPGVSIVSRQRLDQQSPSAGRRDVQGELTTGFPYSVEHAAAVGALLTELILAPLPRKGLITDLDDTLWAGILDEVGPEHVSWTSDSHRHGLYQQLLGSLASAGVLIAVASRNDPALVAQALARPDLLIAPDAMFPVEADWGPKSVSIGRILKTWNVAADAVVFVDDSPLELDEAAAAFPGLETVAVPAEDDAVWPFLWRLRELFGKDTVTTEDELRLQSIRAATGFRQARAAGPASEDFLAGVGGSIEFSRVGTRRDRALDLIDKTNQFNLNGRRLTEADMSRAVDEQGHRLVTVSYADKYGPLGLIAALLVAPTDTGPVIETWAMSCRAFARRVEHHTLRFLFDTFDAESLTMRFRRTDRNLAFQEFLGSMLGEAPEGCVQITRATFDAHTQALVHQVVVAEP